MSVLIVGGGCGGFTSALTLHRAGIPIQLITREKSFGSANARHVVVAGSAVRILDRLGIGTLFRSYGTPITHGTVENERGSKLFNLDVPRTVGECWVVPRPYLQQLFVEALPSNSVAFSTRLRAIHSHPNVDFVAAELTHSSELRRHGMYPASRSATSRIDANLVIGADGLASAVRGAISRPMLTTSYTSCWNAVAITSDTDKYPMHSFCEIWGSASPDVAESDRPRFGYVRTSKNAVAWRAVFPSTSVLRPFRSKLRDLFNKFPSRIQELLSRTSEREIFRRQLRTLWNDSSIWIDHDSYRIALVGEAGRAGELGTLHHGCSLAIEDGYCLANYVSEQGGPTSPRLHIGLRAYEQNRSAHTARARSTATLFHRMACGNSFTRTWRRSALLSSLENRSLNIPQPESNRDFPTPLKN